MCSLEKAHFKIVRVLNLSYIRTDTDETKLVLQLRWKCFLNNWTETEHLLYENKYPYILDFTSKKFVQRQALHSFLNSGIIRNLLNMKC